MIDIINLIFFPVMWGPLIWEIADNWKVDKNNKSDVYMRALLMVVVALTYGLVQMVVNDVKFYWWAPRGLAMTIACFFFVYNYAMGARHAPDRDWFSYLGDTYIDDVERPINPWWRFIIRVVILSLASVWYW
jgi:hypothetical protein